MELPDILNKITHSEVKGKVEYFWALEIWDEGVKSAIWTVVEGKTRIMALGSSEIWDGTDENLPIAVDKSIVKAMESFTLEKEEPSKVIFGLPEDWSSESKIRPEKLNQLQNLCEQLEFKPIGFVATFDAINHHLKDLEGMPPTVILVNPWQQYVNVSLIEVGKSLGVEKIVRSHNLAADVYEGLLHFEGVEAMPSRILLFNGHELEEARQVLIAYPWQNNSDGGGKLPFFHLPKIEILPYDFDITAVALSGGKEVAKSLGVEVNPESENLPVTEGTPIAETAEPVAEQIPEKSVEPITGDFGFIKGRDIATLEEPKVETVIQNPVAFTSPEAVADYVFPESEVSEPLPNKSKFKFKLPSFKFPSVSGFSMASRLPIIGLLFLLVIAVIGAGIGLYWYNVPKADIILYVSGQSLERDFEMLVDANQETLDTGNMIMPAQVKETKLTGESSITTTGEKTIGDQAKGEITIFNRTDNQKVFAAGTVVVGPGGLKFTLDRETNIASKTPDLVSGVDKWGETKTAVTAVGIGTQYNLASNSQFTISTLPSTSFLAKNEQTITGGTSRQIQAVSDSDQKDLLDQLTKDLSDKGKIDLANQISSDENLIDESINATVDSAVYDRKIGEEAQSLSLKLTLKISGLSYKKDDFAVLVENKLKDSIPDGYTFKKEETTGRFEVVNKNTDGSILFKVYVTSNLLPKVAVADIINNVKGKNKAVALKYLSSISGVTGAEINLNPELPAFLKTVPRKENLILLEVRSR
jgi:hypothetical protein